MKSEILVSDIYKWIIDKSQSSLRFKAMQYGQSFEGDFSFDGQIFFDPEKLDKSKVRVYIDISSIKTGSVDRDSQAKSKDWFDVATYPNAVFDAEKFEKGNIDNSYIAHGYLTLRGVKLPVQLPFNLKIVEEDHGKLQAIMAAEVELSRFGFGVGQGQWNSEDAISDKVTVYIGLVASSH